MTVSFHPEAENEFSEAISYFEDQQRNLGIDFSAEVHKTIQRIKANPRSWTIISRSIRRILVHRFPFGILYHYDLKSAHIYIVAVMHLRKKPGYWINRMEE
ncbi:MAG: type II toxin-antitoxin system RelE/ParE family toxin [Bacteroidota bacterium]